MEEFKQEQKPVPNPEPEPAPEPAPLEDDRKQEICDNAAFFANEVYKLFRDTPVRDDYTIFVFFDSNPRYRGYLTEHQNSDIQGPGTGRSSNTTYGYQLPNVIQDLNLNDNALTRVAIGPRPRRFIGTTNGNETSLLTEVLCEANNCVCTFRDETTLETSLGAQETRAATKSG